MRALWKTWPPLSLADTQQTNHELWVGSKCIEQFQVPVLDDHGQLLTGSDVARRLNSCKRNARIENVLRALQKLSESEPKLENVLHYYRQHGRLTPNQMSLMEWRLTDNQIDFELKDFKISLRRSVHKDQIAKMPQWKLDKISPAFTGRQRELVDRLRSSKSEIRDRRQKGLKRTAPK